MSRESEEALRDYSDGNTAFMKEVKMKRLQNLKDLKHILGSAHGRRFMKDLLSGCMLSETTFTGNSQTYFNEGVRSVGLKILRDIWLVDPKFTPNLIGFEINKNELVKREEL